MSYRERDRDRRDSGHGSRHDHRSSRPSGSRRSPSPSPPPKPRSDKELPEAFGRVPETTKDDDSNVLQRMRVKFVNAPLGSLTKCLDGNRKIKVWTRNFKEVRGICTGYVLAFDKHWNIIMRDVDEVYLKPRKSKTPFLDDLQSTERFAELPKKVPKKKKDPKAVVEAKAVETETESAASGTDDKGKKKKKKKRCRKKKPQPHKRHIEKLFVRGDNIVMAAILDVESEDEVEEGEEED